MKKPCIALDVSKGESYYQGFISIDKPIGKAKPITHSKEGFDEVISMAKEIKKEHGDILFIFEATGIYHKGLQMYLEDNNEKYIILNPLEAAKIRKSQLRATKTDKRDCKNIASAYFLRNYRIHNKQDDVYEELRVLNRRYGFLVQQLRMLKVEFRAYLDIVYPNFDELYSDMYTQIPIAIIRNNLHPN
ncbi:MAG: IS110 family transposase, partial [Candidatus Phytoplasma sp.]|nr:IS110 family transposase [Phytoplasma sp.]